MSAGYTCRSCLRRLKHSQHGALIRRFTIYVAPTRNAALEIQPSKATRTIIPSSNRQFQSSTTTTSPQIRYLAPKTEESSQPRDPERSNASSNPSGNVLLKPNNLFHYMSHSPSDDMRRRAAYMNAKAYCPHSAHQRTRMPLSPSDPEAKKPSDKSSLPPRHVRFECPDCGIPTYCCEDHWADDYESHMEICETLRQVNEDDHDLRSGRFFPEFEYPQDQQEEFPINLSNWDTYMFSKEYNAVNNDRSMRQVTRGLTYPLTIGSVISELSPYGEKQDYRFTHEGLRSFNALRYNLHPPLRGEGGGISGLRPNPPPMRIFILGARAESSLPRNVWHQLPYLFPRVAFHLHFIGPESMANRDREMPAPAPTQSNPFGAVIEGYISGQLKISTFQNYYQELHEAQIFQPFDPYFDCFVLFHPGLGHPASSHEWADTIPQLLETKVPIICTGYTEWDLERDRKWVEEKVGGEMDILMTPGENNFRSLRWEINDLDPQDVSCGNWGVWAFRGKRYEATSKEIA